MRLGLQDRPGRHAANRIVIDGKEGTVGSRRPTLYQFAGVMQSPIRAELVSAQEYLVGGMRAVGLVLVNERRCGVGVLVDVIGCAEDAVCARQIGGAR